MRYSYRRMAFLILGCALMLSGCGKKEEAAVPYENTSVTYGMLQGEIQSEQAKFFASDLCVTDQDVNNEEGNSFTSASTGVFDLSSREVVYADNVFEKLYPASTTKIMTALVALKYGNLTDTVTVSAQALQLESGSSVCNLKEGDTPTLEQCLYGLLIKSGNDAANAIAEHISGSQEAFVELMNEEAKALGAVDTHFVNPSGLQDEDHYTTAYDLYLMFQEAIKNETFLAIIHTDKYLTAYNNASGERISVNWTTTNQYLTGEASAPETITVIGGKTGTTSAAGACLILLSENGAGEQDVSIVMKSQDKTTLYSEMTELLNKTVK